MIKLADFWDISLVVVSASIGFLSNYFIENRKKKKDELKEYRKELKKYMDDIIFPLYVIFNELFINLIGSVDVMSDPPKIVEGTQLTSSRKEIREAQIELDTFLKEKELKLNLIFPENLQSWKLIRLSAGINSIVNEIDKGENPVDKINNLIAECIDFQKNIKILLGFTFDERLLTTYLDEPINKYEKIKKLFAHARTQKLQLIFSLVISGYLGQFSYWMSVLRVIYDTIKAGCLRSAPYISEYNRIYGIKWGVHFALRTPIQYHILMIAVIAFMFWSFYTLYKVTRGAH